MGVLTRDQILAADDIKTESVDIPEWGGTVLVRGMTGRQRDKFEEELTIQRGKSTIVNLKNLRAKLVSQSCVDESGALLFTPTDVDKLGDKAASALQVIFVKAQVLSGITKEDVDELTAELGNDQSDGSGSASQ